MERLANDLAFDDVVEEFEGGGKERGGRSRGCGVC